MKIFLTVVFITGLLRGVLGDDIPCIGRATQYGEVCVCNSTYCDTITRPSPLPKGQYYHYITSQDSPGFSRTTGSFSDLPHPDDNNTVVFTVNRTILHQEIVGFGGAFTDSTGLAISSLPQEAQDKLLESYFSTNGLEYTMGRVPIAGSDFSPKLYTYDEVPGDDDLSHFNLTDQDFDFKIPYIKRAMSLSPYDIKLMGVSFTAPFWMKTSNTTYSSYVRNKYFGTYANYHIKFLDAYAQEGIKFWLLTGGNEVALPFLFPPGVGFSTVALPVPQRQWVKNNLGPALRASNHSHVKFALLDDQRPFAKYWIDKFAADPEVFELVEGIALHWYWDFYTSVSILDYIHKKYPEKLILYTESSFITVVFGGQPVELGSWNRGAMYAYNIITNLNHFISSHVDWNMALDTEGGPTVFLATDCAIIVNSTSSEFYKNPIFYAQGHFSKFIPPGSRRVELQSSMNETSNITRGPVFESQLMSRFYGPNNKQESDLGDSDNSTTTANPLLPTFPSIPAPVVPKTIFHVATVNPDNSSTVILFNSQDVPAVVTIVDEALGSISTTLAAQSINTFVYCPNN